MGELKWSHRELVASKVCVINVKTERVKVLECVPLKIH